MARLLLAIGLVAASAFGRGLPELIADLGAADLATRDAAETALHAAEGFTLADVEAALSGHDLSDEQRLRLENIGRNRFAGLPKAGLGIRFGDPRFAEGVPIAGVVEGFPASAMLKPGDVILTMAGQPLVNQAHMGAIILSHQPGETIRVELIRYPPGPLPPGRAVEPRVPEMLTLHVPLGDYEDLQTNIVLTPPRLEAAYRQRLARTGAESGTIPTVGAGVTPLEWLAVEGYRGGDNPVPHSQFLNLSAWRLISFGGQPRSGVSIVELRRGDASAMQSRSNRALQADGVYDQLEEALAGYRALARRLEQIRAEVRRLSAAPAAEAAEAARRLERLREESSEIEQSLVEIRGLFDTIEP